MDKLYDVTILGENWTIIEDDEEENPLLKDCDGYTDVSIRKIVIDNFAHVDKDRCLEDMDKYRKKVIRHEIVHAFLIESGLDGSSLESESWARNEEMVDWFARQSPKIFKVMQEIEVL